MVTLKKYSFSILIAFMMMLAFVSIFSAADQIDGEPEILKK